jgi:hypothetical protein
MVLKSINTEKNKTNKSFKVIFAYVLQAHYFIQFSVTFNDLRLLLVCLGLTPDLYCQKLHLGHTMTFV